MPDYRLSRNLVIIFHVYLRRSSNQSSFFLPCAIHWLEGQSSERSQEVKVMVLLLRGYHETVLLRLTNLMPTVRSIYVTPPSLPTPCSVYCSVLRVLKRFSLVLSLISARTHKHGGFCLKTGAPQRGKSSFSLKRVWWPISLIFFLSLE